MSESVETIKSKNHEPPKEAEGDINSYSNSDKYIINEITLPTGYGQSHD